MLLHRFATVDAFLELAGDFLIAREAEHNLIFGICSTIQADPTTYGDQPPYLAAVVHGNSVIGAAIRTPPWRLILSEIDHPRAIELFAEDLSGAALPGVHGPTSAAAAFARAWSRLTDSAARPLRQMRAFRLTEVNPPAPASGLMVPATQSHQAVVAAWLEAFHVESLSDDVPHDYGEMAARRISGDGRRIVLWMDDGRPVSLTGIGGRTPNGIRIGPVYTPPELRGRGYASNLVAAASQMELDAGRRFVFLFTDLANPTANRIYRAIGYEPVTDFEEFAFG